MKVFKPEYLLLAGAGIGTLLALLMLSPALADEVFLSATVQPYVSAVFSYNTVDFGAVNPGTTGNAPVPDYKTGVYNVSLDVNSDYEVTAYLVNGIFTETYGLTLYFAISTDSAVDGTFYVLNTSSQVVYSGGPFFGTQYHQYKLDVSSTTGAGDYTDTAVITYSLV